MIYRGYDQAGLDAQYNLRARWPQAKDFMAGWMEAGARERQRPGWRRDLSYGPELAEQLDLIVPATARKPPLLVFIHGGYWQAMSHRDFTWLAPAYVKAGLAFASVNYALAPMVSIEAITRQMRAAIAWLWREAPALGFDPDRIVVAGHSAGGHLAAMCATRGFMPAAVPQDVVKGALCLSGVFDLAPMMLTYQQPVLKLDPGQVARCSPIRLAGRPGVRVVCAVGGDETDEFLRQQRDFVAAWRGQGIDARVAPAPGLHHFDVVEKLADWRHPIGRAVRGLLAA